VLFCNKWKLSAIYLFDYITVFFIFVHRERASFYLRKFPEGEFLPNKWENIPHRILIRELFLP
jgi:hypothetical protein